ncbi:ATP12 chaperone protein [Thalassovita gelatinovora]|uniref:ATP12 chaperone protein n=1 Tax=Thalassovita gelatinovora TaxID=53501 RepID=A0A0P1FGU7_THAGE|nr:ATP12 family protein [Thalassovita gelatinovora]QIZ81800.1 ATPase [Thalassovita gelatinovora]CUH67069.1 ATP12 chaperone protein [Thalassovita gelatinovora]SEP81182.1 Chaperone required for the assembly of the F1-ATPase [Thalassovita gelatinovora]
MSILKPKRFWKEATPEPVENGWQVALDGRPVRTPAKRLMVLPTQELAQAVASEWDAQEAEIDPSVMPFTRMSNSALDKVAVQHDAVAEMLAEYGGSDLLCYRATHPQALISRQADAWDPVLDWAAQNLGIQLQVVSGVMPVVQSQADLTQMQQLVQQLDDFRLAAFHDLVSMSGSLILAFAAVRNFSETEYIWQVSRVDETWQAEQWGVDEEAAAQAEYKRQEFLHAKRFFDLSSPA